MGVYDRQKAGVLRMIRKYGQEVTYRTYTSTEHSWQGDTLVPVDSTVFVAFVPIDRVDHESQLYREFTDIQVGYVIGYMPAGSFVPSLKDTIIRNGVTHSIRNIIEYNPNGERIAYVLGMMP